MAAIVINVFSVLNCVCAIYSCKCVNVLFTVCALSYHGISYMKGNYCGFSLCHGKSRVYSQPVQFIFVLNQNVSVSANAEEGDVKSGK